MARDPSSQVASFSVCSAEVGAWDEAGVEAVAWAEPEPLVSGSVAELETASLE